MIAQLPDVAEMQERLAAWCERYRVPGAAIGWMRGDEARTAAAGVTNVDTQVDVTPDTLFQAGSITKVFTTSLIMQLVEQDRLDLDAPVAEYLPALRFGDATGDVTVRHLLTHTSGVDGDFFGDFGRNDDAVERYVEACAELPQVFPVGEMWSYCNAGFVVLGRIIEVLTGMPWHRALVVRLLGPLGLEQTVVRPEDALLRRTSAGHHVSPSLEISLARPWNMPWAAGPAGSTMCSTVSDLLAFARMHLEGGAAPGRDRLLSPESVRAMQEPQVELPRAPGAWASHWGLGWMLFDWGGRRVIGHDGGTIGQASSVRILPDERVAVAVLTNSPGGNLLASRVMYWLFGQSLGIDVPPRPSPPEQRPEIDLEPYAGVYQRYGVETSVRLEGGALVCETVIHGALSPNAPPPPAIPLLPVDSSLFLQREPSGVHTPVVFSGFERGRPRYMFINRVARRVDGGAP